MPISRQLMYWLIASSKGGLTRANIVYLLKEKPMNLNQIAEETGLHYKTVQHHIEVLMKNNFLVSTGEHYGKAYFVSQDLEDKFDEFEKIAKRTN